MDLTPIKIRGKKRSAQTADSRHSVASLLNPHLDPKGKRPLRPTDNTSDLAAARPAKTARYTLSRPDQSSSLRPLERLPTELLESIFFLCLNISLPQASPIIGQALASTHVKSQLVLRVFASGNTHQYPITLGNLVPTLKEQAELQSAILRTKWMTLPFLQQLIPDYIVTTIIREFIQRSLLWLGKEPVTDRSGPTIREHLKDPRFNHTGDPGLPGFLELKWPTKVRGQTTYLGIGLQDGLVTLRTLGPTPRHVEVWDAELSCNKWRILCGVEGCQIPEKLLRGPWTDEKCAFLEVAIRGNAAVDWVGSTSGEVAERGLVEAIREHNPRAIRALVARGGNPPVSRPLRRDALNITYELSDERQLIHNPGYPDLPVRRGVGIVPSQKHLRMALLEEDGPEDVIGALFSAAETNFDLDDYAIHEWVRRVVHEEDLGDEKAERILWFQEEIMWSRS